MRSVFTLIAASALSIVSTVVEAAEHPAYANSDKNIYEVSDDHPIAVDFNGEGTVNLAARDELSKRVTPGVYICTDSHWGGPCYWRPVNNLNQCYGMPVDGYGNGSFGVDKGIKCKIYASANCIDMPVNYSSDWIKFPGVKGRGADALNLPVTETRSIWTYHAFICEKA